MYEIFEHTADLGFRVRAETREELFREAARALFSVVVANLEAVQSLQERTYRIEGDADDYLLFDWLSELLYTYETEHLLLAEFEIEFDEGGLRAIGRGEPIDRQRHQLGNEVKAITYHQLRVEHTPDGWLAEVIVDI